MFKQFNFCYNSNQNVSVLFVNNILKDIRTVPQIKINIEPKIAEDKMLIS